MRCLAPQLSAHRPLNIARTPCYQVPGSVRGLRCRPLRAAPEDRPDGGSVESLFSQELKRRGLSSIDEADTPSSPQGGSATSSSDSPASPSSPAAGTNPFASPSPSTATRTRSRAPPPMMAPGARQGGWEKPPGEETDGQRQRSVDMVNEGLEGLIPRGKLLLQLGGSVFLGFLPFMLAFSLLFTGIYFVFGDSFLHGGRTSSGPPSYIDPERLLAEPTADPYVLFDNVKTMYSAPDPSYDY